jgi:hypothetical protein
MDRNDLYFIVSALLGILALLGMDWKLVLGRVSMKPSQFREILLLIAVVGSLVMSSIGWYSLSHIKRYRSTPLDKMEVFYGKTYTNEKVELDGKDFQKCQFTNVTLVYHGTDGFGLEHNAFNGGLYIETDDNGSAGLLYLLKATGWIRQDVPVSIIKTPNNPVPLKVD